MTTLDLGQWCERLRELRKDLVAEIVACSELGQDEQVVGLDRALGMLHAAMADMLTGKPEVE